MTAMAPKLKSRLRRQAFARKTPINSTLVVTERCHLECQQCYLTETPRPELPLERLRQLIDELADNGSLWLTITGGEPMLRPDIYEIVSHARNKGFMITMFTAGTHFSNEKRAQRIAEAGLSRASISFYGADPAIHDEVTTVPGSHEKTVQGIRNLIACGVQVELKFLQMTINRGQLLATYKLAQELGAQFRYHMNITPTHDGKRDPMELQLGEDDIVALLHELADHFPGGLSKITPVHVDPNTESCTAGHSRIVIGVDGQAYPCIDFNTSVGNVFEQSIAEIWQSDAMREIQQIKRFSDPACLVCPDRAFCPRCPGVAVLDAGEPGRPAHHTCLLARTRRRAYEERIGLRPSSQPLDPRLLNQRSTTPSQPAPSTPALQRVIRALHAKQDTATQSTS